jgi:hypothetical protein
VFTRSGLPKYIEYGRVNGFPEDVGSGFLLDDLFVTSVSGNRFVIHRDVTRGCRLIMMSDASWSLISQSSDELSARFLERVDRAARAMARPPVSLPLQWSKFSYENLLAFFALPRNLNPDSLRWIAESLRDGHVCFWRLTDRRDPLPLQNYAPDSTLVGAAIDAFPRALVESVEAFAGLTSKPQRLQPSVDLERVGIGSLVKDHSYSEWLPLLTESQKSVLDSTLAEPLKIRGVAGSGKTLILQLKALTELYRADSRAADKEESVDIPKVLFLTHTWAMAQQVEEALNRLDERGLASYIEAMPLTFLREWLQGSLPPDVEILGEDSLDGKQQQMRLVGEAIEYIRASTWETYRKNTSDWVREGVESQCRLA